MDKWRTVKLRNAHTFCEIGIGANCGKDILQKDWRRRQEGVRQYVTGLLLPDIRKHSLLSAHLQRANSAIVLSARGGTMPLIIRFLKMGVVLGSVKFFRDHWQQEVECHLKIPVSLFKCWVSRAGRALWVIDCHEVWQCLWIKLAIYLFRCGKKNHPLSFGSPLHVTRRRCSLNVNAVRQCGPCTLPWVWFSAANSSPKCCWIMILGSQLGWHVFLVSHKWR